MQIIIIGTPRENANDQSVEFDLTDDSFNTYAFRADIPKGVDIQACLNSNMAKYLLLIRGREYPEAPAEVRKSLEDMEAWISDGKVVPIEWDEDGEVIKTKMADEVPWIFKHPDPSAEERIAILEAKIAVLEAK